MDQLINELDALEHIAYQIKQYRQQTLVPLTRELIDAHLKRHLSIQEWIIWRRIQANSK